MNAIQSSWNAIGLMSGTSCDGLDIAACRFEETSQGWKYELIDASTIPYNTEWRTTWITLPTANAHTIAKLHNSFGNWCGEQVNSFLASRPFKPHFISSHGHTIFHNPKEGYTFQLGSGAAISAVTGITTICDFRTSNVALNGQGAPLVPIGDRLLFAEFDACLNLGGFANISFETKEGRIAFDISPLNIVLNYLAQTTGVSFDRNGAIAASGTVSNELLEQLQAFNFYSLPPPKSLSREWVEKEVLPLLQSQKMPIANIMKTFVNHAAMQIAAVCKQYALQKVLVTGGGAHNQLIINTMQHIAGSRFVVPKKLLIDYKEALIFAFLGLLRLLDRPNCLASATGSSFDHCSGAVYTSALIIT